MSIIQEALKKIEKPEGPQAGKDEGKLENKDVKPVLRQEINKPAPAAGAAAPKYVYYTITAALLVVLAGIVIKASHSAPSGSSPVAIKKPAPILPKIERLEEPARPLRRRENTAGFVLNGIMQLVDGPRAIINDIIVGEGETINGAKVEKIKKDGVLLKYNDSEVDLNINK